ncbi:peroxynitrite isomerase THAP4-like [Sceloporus undulatus]|uniref:peroxynitrite isomerase THAP4-like n=1 Tax=Sceloporus undulatus TaxID=8520 RepID=UPI001C4BC778|nr:peroxynitrite isomerase THAP4-like [Sceloporus undulatus]
MVKSCCAINCNNKFSLGNNISFHRFPLGKKDVLKKWVWNIRRKNFTPTRHHVICSEHFCETDYLENVASGRRYLKPEAIPSVFNIPERLKKGGKKRRSLLQHKPPEPPPSHPLKIKDSDTDEPSLGSDVVGLEHSYSLPTSPGPDLPVAQEQGPAAPGKNPTLLQSRPWRECRERTIQYAPEEPMINSDVERQHFRDFCYQEGEAPRAVCSRLRDLCRRWLKPGRHSKLQMLELVILEQFLTILPQQMQEYIKEEGPANCDQAVALAEDFLKSQQEQKMQQPLTEVVLNISRSKKVSSNLQHSPIKTGGRMTNPMSEEDDNVIENQTENIQAEGHVSEEGISPEDISSVIEVVEKLYYLIIRFL